MAEKKAANNIKQAQLQAMSDALIEKMSSVDTRIDAEASQNDFDNFNSQNTIELDTNLQTLSNAPKTSKENNINVLNNKNIKLFNFDLNRNGHYKLNKKDNDSVKNLQRKTNTSDQKNKKCDCAARKDDLILEHFITIKNELIQQTMEIEFIRSEVLQIRNLQEKMAGKTQENYCASILQLQNKYLYDIPFKTVQEFQDFDKNFKLNESLSKDVDTVLQECLDPSFGISKCTVSILKRFLDKDVAVQYVAIKKKKNKFVMKTTQLFNKIEVTIKQRRELMSLHTSDKELITSLSNVVCNAGAWYKSSLKTSHTSLVTDEMDENIFPETSYAVEGPKIIATGTITNGVLKIDNNQNSSIKWPLNNKNDETTYTSNSDNSYYEEKYLKHFVK